MLPREFSRRVDRASREAEEEEESSWSRALMITNTLRKGLLDAKPLTLDDLRGTPEEVAPPSRQEYEDDLAQLEAARARSKSKA